MAIFVNKDPVQGLVDYINDIKPYHTKIVDVLVEYVYTDPVNVTVLDTIEFDINMDLNRYTLYCSPDAMADPDYALPPEFPTGYCSGALDNYMNVTIGEDLQFSTGTGIHLKENIGVVVDDATASDGFGGGRYDLITTFNVGPVAPSSLLYSFWWDTVDSKLYQFSNDNGQWNELSPLSYTTGTVKPEPPHAKGYWYDTGSGDLYRYNNDRDFGLGGFSIERTRLNVDIDDSGIEFTVDINTNVLATPTVHNFSVGQPIHFWAVGSLPYYDFNGQDIRIIPYQTYYVVDVPSTTEMKVSETLGGTEIDLVEDGSGTFYLGQGIYEPFLKGDVDFATSAINITIPEVLEMSNEVIFDSSNPENGINVTAANAAFEEKLDFHVGQLILTEYIGVGINEVADANINSGASFIGSWDMPFWDIGTFDEELGVIIRLYGQ